MASAEWLMQRPGGGRVDDGLLSCHDVVHSEMISQETACGLCSLAEADVVFDSILRSREKILSGRLSVFLSK
jgi:hypothetical protein